MTHKPINIKGILKDNEGNLLETVILGKTLSLIKKYINLEKNYFWIVYPRNKNTNNLHLQIAGIWDPHTLDKVSKDNSKKDLKALLDELNLSDNYFSIRGELVYINSQKKELVIKISPSPKLNKFKNNAFKITLVGEISIQFLNSFISCDVIRDGKTLRVMKYEIIEANIKK